MDKVWRIYSLLLATLSIAVLIFADVGNNSLLWMIPIVLILVPGIAAIGD